MSKKQFDALAGADCNYNISCRDECCGKYDGVAVGKSVFLNSGKGCSEDAGGYNSTLAHELVHIYQNCTNSFANEKDPCYNMVLREVQAYWSEHCGKLPRNHHMNGDMAMTCLNDRARKSLVGDCPKGADLAALILRAARQLGYTK